MGFVFARLEHKYFEQNKIQNFCVKINNNNVKLEQNDSIVDISISGRKSNEKLISFFFELLSMMFLYLGSFPRIKEMMDGQQKVDINRFASKFFSYSYFERKDAYICEISERTINDQKYTMYKQLPQMPLYSMHYLVSDHYQYMNIAHKLTLLTHIIEGITSIPTNEKQLNEIKNRLRMKYNIPTSDKVGNYFIHTDMALTPFFKIHSNFNCGIIPLFGKNRYNFLKMISDTRNWYSHFFKKSQKRNRIKSGMEMVIFYEIIIYCLRIYLTEEMNIIIEKDVVKEYLYTIHDWILEIKYGRNEPLKSKTYLIEKDMREITEQLRNFVQKHQIEFTITE